MTQTMKLMIDALLGRTRLTISENERALVLVQGRFSDILTPGEHVLRSAGKAVEIERHALGNPDFSSSYAQALFRERPDLVEAHLTEIRTSADEIALITRNGQPDSLLGPDERRVVWTAAGPWTIERFDVREAQEIPAALARRIERLIAPQSLLSKPGMRANITRVEVENEQAGLLFVDGAYQRMLGAGKTLFWSVGRSVSVKLVDLRRHALDVSGQEILTKDRVSIRVNLAADYRVTDPLKAVREVKDYSDALYRAVQYAFRKTLGAKTLDEILANKVSVDAEAAEQIRSEMREIGIEVGEIALKDVILPGEMREILNQVVSAEKQAQANVIRRREETAATRSLLNTAKVMEENPIMLRLKELEALETIAGRVGNLVVHNGPQGLLSDIAKLK
ncbi:MAG: slipin family protein [Neomegalonema sp.]|nr:slipin family protein [Neomegalonema sp.]